jgi:hypothetical protein
LNEHEFNGFRQRKMHTAEPLLSESSAFEFVLAIEELIGHKSQVFLSNLSKIDLRQGKNNSLQDP